MQDSKKYIVKIADILKSDIPGRQDHSDPYVHDYDTHDRENECQEMPPERYVIKKAKHKENENR